jgi:hypothetical protein
MEASAAARAEIDVEASNAPTASATSCDERCSSTSTAGASAARTSLTTFSAATLITLEEEETSSAPGFIFNL